MNGQLLHELARRLWPIHRSITGDGTRETLWILQEYLPGLTIHEVPTGAQVFDWTIPDEWNVRGAQLIGPDGEIVVDRIAPTPDTVGHANTGLSDSMVAVGIATMNNQPSFRIHKACSNGSNSID